MAAEKPSQTPPHAPGAATPSWWAGFVRRKKNIGPATLTVLTITACLPLFVVVSRILAFPSESPGITVLLPFRALGSFLNQNFSLDWVPPGDRPAILFLLLIPAGALLIAVFRLVFGLRVLGLRAILLAIGFQAIGLLPSLSLMLVVIGAIVLIRPWIRRIGLPLYARIAFILCLSVIIMIGAVLVAPWLGSDTVWRVAFFPVIIMAMLAEAVAKTLEQDDAVMAIWRGAWTIVLALVLVLIDGPVSRLNYQFPELILTQLMAIVFIAELFDLRLLEAWPARLSRYLAGVRPWYPAQPKVAVVRNRDTPGLISRLGRPPPPGYAKQSVQRYVDALRGQGFEVKVFEGDMKLLSELARFLPPDPRRGTPGGIVFNLATGVQGEGRFTHVPAILEMAGIPYTGPGPLAHARLSDRWALLTLLAEAHIPVPRHYLISEPTDVPSIQFPASARPRFEPDAKRILVRNRRALRDAVQRIHHSYNQPVVVEQSTGGRKISVAVLGNDTIECLPLVEVQRGAVKACPAPLDEGVAEQIRGVACAAYLAAGCRDYARIDLRISRSGEPAVTGVKWVDVFGRRGSFVTAANAHDYTFATLMRRIVGEAARRYVMSSRPHHDTTQSTPVISLANRRAAAG